MKTIIFILSSYTKIIMVTKRGNRHKIVRKVSICFVRTFWSLCAELNIIPKETVCFAEECWGEGIFFLQLSRVHAQLFAFERNCYLWDADRRWSAAFTRLLPKLWPRFPLKPKPETENELPTENSVYANYFLPTSTPKETTEFPKTMSRKKKKYSSLAFICYAVLQSARKESRKLINILTTQRNHKMRST